MENKKQQIIENYGYTVLQKFGGRAYLCRRQGLEKLSLVKVAIEAQEMSRIEKEKRHLQQINQFLGESKTVFTQVIIPNILDYQETAEYRLLVMDYFDNPYPWSEMETEKYVYGGSLLPLESVMSIGAALKDLQLNSNHQFPEIEKWDLNKARYDYKVTLNLLDPVFNLAALKTKMEPLFQQIPINIFKTKPALSNGDFYFRNFLPVGNQLALVDWESARITIPEESAAYTWVLCFNNSFWQAHWQTYLSKQSWISQPVLQYYQLLHTLKLLAFWYLKREQAPISLNLFKLLDNTNRI